MPYKHDSKEIVNFYQRWRLLYAIRNKEFAAEHLKRWNTDSFPSSKEILQKELEAKQNGEQSPSLTWPAAIDPISLSPLSAIQTIEIQNQSVMNIDEQLVIENPRGQDLELMQRELAFVYWYQKAYREREKTRTESGSIELGPQKKELNHKAKQAWNELTHYEMKARRQTKINPVLRSIGLYLWDVVQDKNCEIAQAVKDMRGSFKSYHDLLSEYKKNQMNSAYKGTNDCIKRVDVLPLT